MGLMTFASYTLHVRWWSRDQFGHSWHCHHFRLGLEPSEWFTSSGPCPSNWPKESSQHLQTSDEALRGGRYCGESQTEDGAWPFSHSADGHDGTDSTGQRLRRRRPKTGTPFNKDELNAILKFGAEELFKENDVEGDDVCDIDEILKRAETSEDPGERPRPGDELLSAFKSVTFAVAEDEAKLDSAQPPTKEWDSIIPEDLRAKIEAEEKEKEMADLYLPPRSRTATSDPTGNNTAANNDALRKIKRKRKREAVSEEESDSDGGGKPKKRGRPKAGAAGPGAKGFSDNQIRKIIKSFKHFPNPLTRIERIARDCGIPEKGIPELRKLGEQLILQCQVKSISDLPTYLMTKYNCWFYIIGRIENWSILISSIFFTP